MKYITSIVFLIGFTMCISSCKEDEENNTMDFKITGISNTTITRSQTLNIPMKVFYLGGNLEEIALIASGLPNNVTISFSPDKGEPDFSATETIHANGNADTGKYVITITATSLASGKTFSKPFELTVTPVPNGLPRISLLGDSSMTSILNDTYTDPGYSAFDNEDGNITANVVVSGTVNEDSAGTYFISYVVYDSNGAKDSVVRKVRIRNTAEFMNGTYTCTPSTPPGASCITGINISDSINNKVYCANATNCYTGNLYFDIDIPAHKVILDTQTVLFQGLMHTYSGEATYSVTGPSVQFNLIYTDTYTDSIGNTLTNQRIESYLKF